MNLLANPGFETPGATADDAADWTRSTEVFRSYRSSLSARSGGWGASISRLAKTLIPITFTAGWWETSASVVPGRLHALEFHARRDSGGEGVVARARVDGVEVARAVEADGWQSVSGLVLPAASSAALRFDLDASPGALASTWSLDDVVLEEVPVPRGFEFAYRAVWNRIATINGAAGGYWHDLGGRVFARDVQPPRGTHALPYACLPVDDAGSWPDQGGRHVTAVFRQPVVIYLRRNTTTGIEASAALDALRMADDLTRCLLPDGPLAVWNLGDRNILEVELMERDIVVPDAPSQALHPYVEFVLGIKFTAGREDLGPSAS